MRVECQQLRLGKLKSKRVGSGAYLANHDRYVLDILMLGLQGWDIVLNVRFQGRNGLVDIDI